MLGCLAPHIFSTRPPNRGKFSNKSGQQIGGPLSAELQHIGWQHSFPLTDISVPIPKHTFLLLVAQLESHGNLHSLCRGFCLLPLGTISTYNPVMAARCCFSRSMPHFSAWYSPSICFLDRSFFSSAFVSGSFFSSAFVSGVLCAPYMLEQVCMAPHRQCALHNYGHGGMSGCGA